MVINQRNHSHRFAIVVSDRLLNERTAHQAPDRFATIGITMLLAVFVEQPEQFPANCHTEANEGVFHRWTTDN